MYHNEPCNPISTGHSLSQENETSFDHISPVLDSDSSEKYIYKYDDPLLNEDGFVQVFANKIILHFPEKNSSSNYLNVRNEFRESVNFFIDQQWIFSYSFLPILSQNDYNKTKDMIYKCYTEYTALIHWHFWPLDHFLPKLYNDLICEYKNQHYTLYCYEDRWRTSIELNRIQSKEKPCTVEPIHVQIFIGNHLLFCSFKDLTNYEPKELHFIVSFLLYKLMKY